MSAPEPAVALLRRLAHIQRGVCGGRTPEEASYAIVRGAADLVRAPVACLELDDPDGPEPTRIAAAVGLPEWRTGIPPGALTFAVRDGERILGRLAVSAGTTGRTFTAAEREVLAAFAEHASLALTDALAVTEARHRALHDPLTGLPNRSLFLEQLDVALQRAARRGGRVAVLFVDLDGFKAVNDTLGHEAGDHVLCAVARRVRGALRRSDTVARLGGDEFGVIVEDLAVPSDAARAAAQVAAALGHPVVAAGLPHDMRASIGSALSGIDGDEPGALLRAADRAMYRTKALRSFQRLAAAA